MHFSNYLLEDAVIRALKEIGVDNAQGYAIARPAPLASLSTDAARPALVAIKTIERSIKE